MIENFLIEAKKQTYANENAPKIDSSRLNSKDYEYKKGIFFYSKTISGEALKKQLAELQK